MLKKTLSLGLLAATAVVTAFAPVAHAQEAAINKQTAIQNAAAVGEHNTVMQNLGQYSNQGQIAVPNASPYHYPAQPANPQTSVSVQEGVQNGAAIGYGNEVFQNLQQGNWQHQFSK